MFKEYILMALRDLKKRKGRTFLTALGITIGAMLIVTMVSLGTGVKNFMSDTLNNGNQGRAISVQPYRYIDKNNDKEIEKFQENPEEYKKNMDYKLIENIKKSDSIESIKAYSKYDVTKLNINEEIYVGSVRCVGYSIENDIFSESEIKEVQSEKGKSDLAPIKSGRTIENKSGEILIGEQILQSLNLEEKNILNKDVKIIIPSKESGEAEKTFKVVGIIDENFNASVGLIVSIDDISEIIGYERKEKNYLENNGYESIELIAKSTSEVDKICDEIKDLGYLYNSNKETANSVDKITSSINVAFIILGIIVLIVASIGIVNTMFMAVTERTKSIGIMKAVGANNQAIKIMFLIQSSLIGLIGGSIGILLALGINKIAELGINQYILSKGLSLSISITMPVLWVVIILIGASLLALISGIYPANEASKLNPIDAIRS